jgi:hypothetical protein
LKDLLRLIWKQKNLLPRVQTFAWRLLHKALPTGLRAGRFSVHILQTCCRCGLPEEEFHLFFLCPFARAAWFSHPWFIRSDVLLQGHSTMHAVIIDFLRSAHPHASILNVLNFLWCLWKARNDFLFDRFKSLPYQVQVAAAALTTDVCDVSCISDSKHQKAQDHLTDNMLPPQGDTLRIDLLVSGAKIFSDAAFRSKKVSGLKAGEVATGIGVFISVPSQQGELNVQIQASAPPTLTPPSG